MNISLDAACKIMGIEGENVIENDEIFAIFVIL